jgi:aspartate/methionine/tyrosine aminotransferase
VSHLAERFRPFGTTIFTEMTLLANKHGAVNLAQGFPDFDGPEFIKRAAVEAMGLEGRPGANQYARMFGLPPLNAAIAGAWRDRTGETLDPDTQVCVTSGCTEAICAAMLGLLNPGDEVVLFEPYYDSYRASVAMAGGVPRFVSLHAPSEGCDVKGTGGAGGSKGCVRCTPLAGEGRFWFDPQALASAFTERTRVLLLNTPHNPTGKVFTRDELALIAELCAKHDVVAVVDEVYEHLTYDPTSPHVSLASLPGMAERTLTLSSLGKTFSLTGWKIGWALGPAELVRAVRAAHQFITFATATPLQVGAAAAVGMGPESRAYVRSLVEDLSRSRGVLTAALRDCGFRVYEPSGAYFVIADWTASTAGGKGPLGGRFEDDMAFCRHLTAEAGVAAIPPSVFYERKELGRPLARFAFCKKLATVEEAARRLRAWAARA